MLPQIRRAGDAAPDVHDPIAQLLACHERIRRFTVLAEKLGRDDSASPTEVAEAAAAVARYFNVALPLHAADEDQSLAPRLAEAASPATLRVLESVRDEHETILATVGEGTPLWTALTVEPGRRPDLAGRLVEVAVRLAEHFAPHLAAEEEILFPAARLLPPDTLAAIRDEMRRRRG